MGDERLLGTHAVLQYVNILGRIRSGPAPNLSEAAKMWDEALDHVLLFGPPGWENDHGFVIANELGVSQADVGPVIEKAGDLV